MASCDTNVLVRLLVKDDAKQTEQVRRRVASLTAAGDPLAVPVTVALELEWVLRSRYRFPKDVVIETFERLLSSVDLAFSPEGPVSVAVDLYREAACGFAECLHLALAADADASPFFTFDAKASRLAGARRMAGDRPPVA